MHFYLTRAVLLIPNSLASDTIINEYGLEECLLSGLEYYSNGIIDLYVIKFCNTNEILQFTAHYPKFYKIYLLHPDRSKFGITQELFNKIKKASDHSFVDVSYLEFIPKI